MVDLSLHPRFLSNAGIGYRRFKVVLRYVNLF